MSGGRKGEGPFKLVGADGETPLTALQTAILLEQAAILACKADPVGAALAMARGRKSTAAAQLGHAIVHGTEAEKQARWASYRATYDELRARNEYLSHEDLCRETAKKHGVCLKTIKRRCPRK